MSLFPLGSRSFQRKILGRKRFLLVDTQGLVIAAKVLTAHLDEREGGKILLLPLVGKLPRLARDLGGYRV